MDTVTRLALIGCGAAVEELHLPALSFTPEAQVTWIVDVQEERARAIARAHGIANVTDDYTRVADVDAALIAVPHDLHASMAGYFLQRHVHVLCEKPLALTTAQARRLAETAAANHLVLAVGVYRRYYPVSRFFRRVIDSEWLGAVERIDAEEGMPWSSHTWDFQSSFMVERSRAGGGVLIDTGSHTLDRILWWFGSPEVGLASYRDNSYGGVETDCEVHFTIPWRGREVPVRVELSRTRTLRNTFQVFTSHGMIEAPANVPDQAWFVDRRLITGPSGPEPIPLDLSAQEGARNGGRRPYFQRQLVDFCRAVREGGTPVNAGETVVPLVRLIERCYAERQSMPEPWVDCGLDRTMIDLEEASA